MVLSEWEEELRDIGVAERQSIGLEASFEMTK